MLKFSAEHTVLKLNDYTLEDGESSVFVKEARHFADVPVDAPKPLNSYQIWQQEFTEQNDVPRDFARRGQILRDAWAEVGEEKKAEYREKSAEMKEVYRRAKERAIECAKVAQIDAEKEEERILKEQNRKSEASERQTRFKYSACLLFR